MSCPRCSSVPVSKQVGEYDVTYCPNCFCYIRSEFNDETLCGDHVYEWVKYPTSNNIPQLRKQCLTCGDIAGTAFKRALVEDFDSLPWADVDLRDSYQEAKSKQWQDFRAELASKASQFAKDRHRDYLMSDYWQRQRRRVFARDGFKCQSCLENPATEVHHKSYNYTRHGFDPAFELVSICRECHQRISQIDGRT